MSTRLFRLLACACVCGIFFAVSAHAATVYDLNPDDPTDLPSLFAVDKDDSPVYITNNTAHEAETDVKPGSATVETLRVGQYSSLNLGFGKSGSATDAVSLTVSRNMQVQGEVRLGKDAGGGAWLPDGATAHAIRLRVNDTLAVEKGGRIIIDGATDATLDDITTSKHSVVSARMIDINGGEILVDDHAELRAGENGAAVGTTAIAIANGGRLVVNSGLRPDLDLPDASFWDPKGVYVDGDVRVAAGGTFAAGTTGGVLDGRAGDTFLIDKGGSLDVSAGDLQVFGMTTQINGNYRAGFSGNGAHTLIGEDGAGIRFGADANIALSRDLARHFNNLNNNDSTRQNITIATGKNIVFENGAPSVIRSGLGYYTLDLNKEVIVTEGEGEGDEPASEDMYFLKVNGSTIQNAVYGNRSTADRSNFDTNMRGIWGTNFDSAMTKNMYDLSVAEYPTVTASGEAGELNKNVLDAFIDGRGGVIEGKGAVDQSLFETYTGASQWGVASVAHNTAGQFMAGLNRRVDRLGAEADRIGLGTFVSNSALGSCDLPDDRDGRFWVGGFSINDKAELDDGVSGYEYKPRGLMLGYDRGFGRLSLGVAGAYGKGDYIDKAAPGGDSEIRSFSGGAYAAYHAETGFNASAFATFSHLDNDIADTRSGMARTADYSSYAWTVGGRVGYDMCLSDRALVQPSIGLERVAAKVKSHTEYLDGVGVMRVGDVKRESLSVPIEVSLGYDVYRDSASLVRLNGTVGYAYDLNGDGVTGGYEYLGLAGSESMRIAERDTGKHRFNLGAGILYTGKRFDLGARYDYFKQSKQETHQAKGSVGLKF